LLIDARAGDTIAAAKVSQAAPVRAACERARAYALAETDEGLRELVRLPDGRARALLEQLVRWLMTRRS
jgi:hypothetical protein